MIPHEGEAVHAQPPAAVKPGTQPQKPQHGEPPAPRPEGMGRYEPTPENIERLRKGKAPEAADGSGKVELHHPGQQDVSGPHRLVPLSPREHRLDGNFPKNHPLGNDGPSKIDRNQHRKFKQRFWKAEAKKHDDGE